MRVAGSVHVATLNKLRSGETESKLPEFSFSSCSKKKHFPQYLLDRGQVCIGLLIIITIKVPKLHCHDVLLNYSYLTTQPFFKVGQCLSGLTVSRTWR